MKKGILYLNYSKDAPAIADHLLVDTLTKEWDLVKNETQSKQFNCSNFLIFKAILYMALKKIVEGEKIVFMVEGKEQTMNILERSGIKIPDILNDEEFAKHDVSEEWILYFIKH